MARGDQQALPHGCQAHGLCLLPTHQDAEESKTFGDAYIQPWAVQRLHSVRCLLLQGRHGRQLRRGRHSGPIDTTSSGSTTTRSPFPLSQTMVDIFRALWLRPYGFPLEIRVDPAGSYDAAFRTFMEKHGVHVEVIPAEAHWRIGLVERRNSVLRDILERVIDSQAVMTEEDFDTALESAAHAINSMTYTHGRPAYMAVFGQIPRLPGGLLEDDRSLCTNVEPLPGAMRPDVLRAEAVTAIAEINVSQALRRALLRKTAASPKDLQIEPGQNCAYWRWQNPRSKSTKKRGGWVVARFLANDPDGRSAWLHSGNTTIQVSLEQLRSAHGFENWQPSREDIAAIKDGATSIQKDLWEDHRADGPPRDEDEYDYDLEVEMPQPLALPLAAPSTEHQQPAASQQQHQDTQTTPRSQPAQQHNTSMEYHQRTTTNVNTGDLHLSVSQSAPPQQPASTSRFGMTRQDRAQYVPLRPGRGRSRTPSRQLAPPSQHTTGGASTPTAVATLPAQAQAQQQHLDIGEMAPVTPPELQAAYHVTPTASQAASNSNPQPPVSGDTTPPLPELVDLTTDEQQQPPASTDPYQHMGLQDQQPPTLVELPQKRPYEALLIQSYGLEPPPYNWDGSPDQPNLANPSTTFARTAAAVLQREGHPVLVTDLTVNRDNDSDDESSSNEKQDPAERMLTRKEAKALDREIPSWQILTLTMPKEKIQAFIDSAIKEENGWKTCGSVEPVGEAEAKAIMTDPRRRRRVLKSRACYRNKSRDPSKLIAKTRVVALGHLDPDLYKINRDAPTPSRTSEYLLLSIYAAGVNGVLQNEPDPWELWSGDVSTAFLQGLCEDRDEPLYLMPPTDELTRRARTFRHPLYRIKGNVYGLANAPRTWYKEVVRRCQKVGYVQHSQDHLMFYKHRNGKLVSLCIVYVDDFLLACSTKYDKEELLSQFTWGSRNNLTVSTPFVFKGKELSLHEVNTASGKRYHLHVTQTEFIKATPAGKLARGRAQEPTPLTATERAEFKSVTGSIQWLSSQTRPDLAAAVSLANRGKETTTADLATLYSAINYAKETAKQGLVFQDVPINKATVVIGYADASWANAVKCSSQQGVLTLLTTPHCSQVTTKANLVDWKSNRSARVCRSTLAAEAMACDDSVDRAYFTNILLYELLHAEKAHRTKERMNQFQVTDSRSLFDGIAAENPKVSEKRTLVSIRSIQEYINFDTCFWVPTHLQWADGLTKVTSALRKTFSDWLRNPYIVLKESEKHS